MLGALTTRPPPNNTHPFNPSQARLSPTELAAARRITHGVNQGAPVQTLTLPPAAHAAAADGGFTLTTASFRAAAEQLRPPRVVRLALLQHAHPASPSAPFKDQLAAAHARLEAGVAVAAAAGARLMCLQELWHMPFFVCTREKSWCEFAEDAVTGPSNMLVRTLARKHAMVIVSSILERDAVHVDTVWNTAVVIGPAGNIIGKHRKNHIPRVGAFAESSFYQEGNTGHPVFDIPSLGCRIGVNICYGRHHPLNWLGFALNGAEIVLNPCATSSGLSEPLWPVEARNAAIAFGFFAAGINRVGTEVFPRPFTVGDGQPPTTEFGHFYGSSYVAAPDGSRSDSAPRGADGVVVADWYVRGERMRAG